MNPYIEIGTLVVEVALIILYSRRLGLDNNKSKVKAAAGFSLFFIPLAILSLFPALSWVRILYSFAGLTILYRYCYDIDLPNSIYLTAIFLILSVLSDILCSYLAGFVGISNNGVFGDAFERITYNVLAKLIHLVLIQIVPYLVKRKRTNVSFVGAVPLLTAQFACLLICLCLYFSGMRSGSLTLETVIGVLATLYIDILVCFYVETISAKNELAREKELAERDYLHSLKYYESVKQSQEETRSLWHEIRKYMDTMQTLVDNGDNPATAQCMNEVKQAFDGLTVNVDVGNNIISGILSIGLQQAKQNKIPFHVDAWVSPHLGVAPQDLFIILGNAIDNAIEECRQLPSEMESYINVSIHQKGKMLAIKVENPCRVQPTPKPGKVHGYGLKNVKKCIEKYNGELQAEQSENKFHFFVLLNMK